MKLILVSWKQRTLFHEICIQRSTETLRSIKDIEGPRGPVQEPEAHSASVVENVKVFVIKFYFFIVSYYHLFQEGGVTRANLSTKTNWQGRLRTGIRVYDLG